MKFQKVTIKQILLGLEALERIAKEEKGGDWKLTYRIAKMQTKVQGIVGDGSPFEYARRNLARQSTILKRPTRPDGSEGDETRVFAGEKEREAFQDQVDEMTNQVVDIPIGFIDPATAADVLKMDRPITAQEMALAPWLFDAAALARIEAELDQE